MKRILIIEDDETIAAIERDYLAVNEFEVDIAATGPEGIAKGRSGRYDLILLDLMLPGTDGFTVCRALRETLDIPILMVTARQEDIDKIKGLGMGADDYITKPFSPNVLVARIKANLAQYDRLKQTGRPDRAQIQMGNILLQEEKLGEQTARQRQIIDLNRQRSSDSQNRNANFSTYWQQRKKTTYRHRRANENRRSKNESREKNNDGNAITGSFSRLGY